MGKPFQKILREANGRPTVDSGLAQFILTSEIGNVINDTGDESAQTLTPWTELP